MNTATKQNEPKIRWIITGTLTTTSALHIGSGASELDERLAHDPAETDSQQGMASLVVRDYRGQPYLPGSAIKGVLRHYAEACGATAAQTIFGEHGKTHADHHAGFVDFLPAYLTSAPEEKQRCDEGMAWYTKKEATGLIAASARERTTRAVAAQKLFHYEAVPDGAVFDVTLHAEGLSKEEVSQLLSLLQGFTGKAESLSLGAKQATGLGVMTWEKGSVKYLSPDKAKQWWHGVRFGFAKRFDEPSPDKAKELWKASIGVEIKPWEEEEYAVDSDVQATPLAPAANRKPITFATTITIDGPFLVSEPAHKGGGNELEGGGNEPDFMPRHTHDGMIELPGGSLHGALRAQAERICRTLGLEVPEGHLAPVYDAKKPENQDIVSWLFGAPGWRSVLRMGRFTALAAPLHEQDFVAIDRFHGGVSGSAKFKGQSVLNPSLAGDLSVDTHRLKVSIDPDAALGLLALTLRDLDDGDIPLGYGAASKGFGQVDTAKTKTLEALSIELQKLNITVDDKVEAFRVYCESKVTEMPTAQTQPLTTAESAVKPLDINTPAQGDFFHNPYAFLPVDQPKDKNSWKSRTDFDKRNLGHHGHDRYALSDAERKPFYSGRIVCSLKNNTPLVVGGKQTKGAPNIVEPFKLGNQIALPATSLRGMIGAIIEAASQSSMRVLEDRELSINNFIINNVHSFFNNIDSELLPFNPERKMISPAEWMLGFVSSNKKNAPTGNHSAEVSAFAGKLRVSFGHPAQPVTLEEAKTSTEAAVKLKKAVKLKILSSPRPPSPAMYFNLLVGDKYVSKSDLVRNPEGHRPNGRKVYLHALQINNQLKGLDKNGKHESLNKTNEPWRSRNDGNDNQKVEVTPIQGGAKFWFHVDFDNLNQGELELLCFALQPCDKYEHRLGMGKSLGLGSVSVVPEALLLVDRTARYSSDTCAPSTHRYHAVWQNLAPRQPNDLPERYRAALTATSAAGYSNPASVSDLANAGAVKVKDLSEALWRAIILTGLPSAVTAPVHTPQMEGENIEDSTFRWFDYNDNNTSHQHLAPFTSNSNTLPTLNGHHLPQRQGGRLT